MDVIIPVSQLRTNIAVLLRRLREDPQLVYKITHHKEVVAELRRPEGHENTRTGPSSEQEIAAFITTFLEGGVPRKKGRYQEVRQLCATSSGELPYRNLDEAMTAIRGKTS